MLEDLRRRVPDAIEVWAGGLLWERARRLLPGVRYITQLQQIPVALAECRAAHGLEGA
jgi:hypothetical protein